MTAISRDAAAPRPDQFPFRLSDNVRFADLDPNQHVNNAVYATYFESSRVLLVKDPANGLIPPGAAWVLVRLDIHFRHELHWPGTIELGLVVAQIGRTSAHFDQAVFANGRCVASARAVTVLVDGESRRPVPLPDQVIRNLRRWQLADRPADLAL
ncbi:MAG TPA: thioesterase family protein [Rhodopseudomonas sp.]|uniref:acyl-CoA thioesterase n=1 Tax=Rhodopseudomonas sp. TaxID=1078 RepID=UPI002ED8C0C1